MSQQEVNMPIAFSKIHFFGILVMASVILMIGCKKTRPVESTVTEQNMEDVEPSANNNSKSKEKSTIETKREEPKAGQVIINSVGMKLVYVSAGEFLMGSNEYDDAKPIHNVKITNGFYMGMYEVTRDQYNLVMQGNPSNLQKTPCPVVQVSWDDAVAFCKKLTQIEKKIYRLPTEAEWEYTCRAGSTTKYCFGDSDSTLDDYAWYEDNSRKIGGIFPRPVGEKKPNAFGLYDMHGNVMEFCSDWYGSDYYMKSPTDNPKGPDAGEFRVNRGGCWFFNLQLCCSAKRMKDHPRLRSDFEGFRVVLESTDPPAGVYALHDLKKEGGDIDNHDSITNIKNKSTKDKINSVKTIAVQMGNYTKYVGELRYEGFPPQLVPPDPKKEVFLVIVRDINAKDAESTGLQIGKAYIWYGDKDFEFIRDVDLSLSDREIAATFGVKY